MKYKKNQVGITRHPRLYDGSNYTPVFKDVKMELKMWKAAEKLSKTVDKGNFDWRQLMFIMHYVMCLQGMDDDEMYKYHSWQLFKISQSQAKQAALEIIGKSAKQMVTTEEQLINKIRNDKEVEITFEAKKPKKKKSSDTDDNEVKFGRGLA